MSFPKTIFARKLNSKLDQKLALGQMLADTFTGTYAEWLVSYNLLDCHFHTGFWRRVIPYT
jgi:hypothetical protein